MTLEFLTIAHRWLVVFNLLFTVDDVIRGLLT